MSFEKKILNWYMYSVIKKNDDRRIPTLTPVKGVEEINNLDYYGDKSKWHLLDIFRPAGKKGELLPVIFDIHGGGWMYGDKDLNKPYCRSLASRGFAVVSISYSLFPEVTFPVPVQEIFKALNYVYDNAEKYGLDNKNMFLTGDSAGGHYAGLVCAIIADEKLRKLYDVDTSAAFNAVGFTCAAFYPNDITDIPLHITKTYLRMFYGDEKKYKENKYYPSNNIISNAVEKFPPMFINSCYNDMVKGHSLKFIRELTEKKIPYELDFPEKEDCKNKMGHVYSVLYPNDWEEAKRTNDNMCGFFRKYIVK